jgi:hypothetical protein
MRASPRSRAGRSRCYLRLPCARQHKAFDHLGEGLAKQAGLAHRAGEGQAGQTEVAQELVDGSERSALLADRHLSPRLPGDCTGPP